MRSPDPDRCGNYSFGRFRLSADGILLLRDGARVPLAPKVLRTLLVLVERAGQVVRKADLMQAVWPDSVVEETGLTRNISVLRQCLADAAQTLIVTVPRIGYRFAGPVVLVDTPPASSQDLDLLAPAGDGGGAGGDQGHAEGAGRSPHRREPRASLRGSTVGRTAWSGETSTAQRLTRLLILPFRLLRDDPETGFLAFSVPDAVVNALSGLESLVVRSSLVASRFAEDRVDLRKIAAEADVDAVVTGTLLRSGEQIRMSAQVLAVPTGTVLWSRSLSVTLREVFDLQDTLVRQIVDSLWLSLNSREQRRLERDIPASPAAYEFFLRGNEAVGPHAIASSSNLRVARELFNRAVELDPGFAPAWARLGRCHYLIGKFGDDGNRRAFADAESCFQQALELSPDLPLAHNLYALFEIDRGRARAAMTRLVSRGLVGSAQPELYAALVQACRFCGLLEASIAAHARVRELDSMIATGVYHTFWQLGDEDRALRESARGPIIEALLVGMRGDPTRAIEMLREREEGGATGLLRSMMASFRAVFEGRRDAALENAQAVFEAFPDPEAVFYVARTLAFFGERLALIQLGRCLERGFGLYRLLVRRDPWLDSLRSTREFQELVERSREAYRESLAAYVEAGGERLLGRVPGPEELASRPGSGIEKPTRGTSPSTLSG